MECEASDSCTKKDEISPVTSVRDDLHITGDGDMAKVCALNLVVSVFAEYFW